MATEGDDADQQLSSAASFAAPEKMVRAHNDCIYTLAIPPRCGRLYCGSEDGGVTVWDTRNFESGPKSVSRCVEAVYSVTTSADGTRFYAALDSGIIGVSARVVTAARYGSGTPNAIVASPDDARLYAAATAHTVLVYDASDLSARPRELAGHTLGVNSVSASPDGRWLCSGSYDCTICVWNARNLDLPPLVLRGHTGSVEALVFTPDSRRLCSGSADCTVRVWNASDWTREPIVLRAHTKAVLALDVSPDGAHLYSGSLDCTIWRWAVRDSAVVAAGAMCGHKAAVRALAVSRDGRRLYSGCSLGMIGVWLV